MVSIAPSSSGSPSKFGVYNTNNNNSQKCQTNGIANKAKRFGSVHGTGLIFAMAFFIRIFVLSPSKSPSILSLSSYWYATSSSTKTAIPIPINPTSTLKDDILSISHLPDESAIQVQFRSNGKCPHPYLVGRLSGPALAVLHWESHSSGVVRGGYRVPLSGTYLLEIIVITCHDFSHDMDYNFQEICLEDPNHHRLTRTNVAIDIDIALVDSADATQQPKQQRHHPMTGFWLHQSDERAAYHDYAAVYTRWQPRGCIRIQDPSHEHFEHPPKHCIEPTDVNRFEPYLGQFQFYQQSSLSGLTPIPFLPHGASQLQSSTPLAICLVGWSHSRTLKASMEQYHNVSLANNNIAVKWIRAKYPNNINNKTIDSQLKDKCHRIILAVGQWPASFSGGHPKSFREYETDVTKLVGRLQDRLENSVQIYFRQIHYNPLTQAISGYCPPRDWRSPPVLDGYNAILRRACEKSDVARTATQPRIQFVDTSFITAPLWDASNDWGHVVNQASHVEALFLLATVLPWIEYGQFGF